VSIAGFDTWLATAEDLVIAVVPSNILVCTIVSYDAAQASMRELREYEGTDAIQRGRNGTTTSRLSGSCGYSRTLICVESALCN
jgi:hypothetical protein